MPRRAVTKNAGYYLRVFRAEHQLNQTQLAQKLGISAAHVSKVESGRSKGLEKHAALRASALLDVPLAVLLGLEEGS